MSAGKFQQEEIHFSLLVLNHQRVKQKVYYIKSEKYHKCCTWCGDLYILEPNDLPEMYIVINVNQKDILAKYANLEKCM